MDSSGGVITGVLVTARDVDTNQSRTALTDAEGTFRLTDIPVGTYELRVEYAGFAPYRHAGITVAIGQTARLAVTLQPAGVVETVAVNAQPPPLDAGQTAVSTAIDTERIEELPVRSRNYLEFVLLAPGVTRAVASSPGTASSGMPDSGFSFGGLRPRSNTLTIDGLDNNDDFAGSSRTELSLETVREFQVLNNGWSAENGGASGGAINVVTKGGANTLHGDAFLFAQPGAFTARPKLEETEGEKPRLQRYRGGMAIGGPIIKSRTFYYAAAEREHADGEAASDIDPNIARSINAALAAGLLSPARITPLTIGLFPTARRETEWSAKVTHDLSGRGTLGARVTGNYNRDDGEGFNSGGLVDATARGTRRTNDMGMASWWTTTLGSRTTNDLRAQVARRRIESQTGQDGAGVFVAGVAEFGTPYVGNNTHDQTYIDVADTMGLSRGSHFLRVGGGIRHVRITGSTTDGTRGLYVFRTLDSFLAGRPDETRVMSATGFSDLRTTRAGAFFQDHWTPRADLTIDVGARFDATKLPQSLEITNRQLSPRLGLAFMPASRWLIRGGAGLFADRIAFAALERPWLTQHRGLMEQVLVEGAGTSPSIYTARRGTWNPRSAQASMGVERQLTPDMTTSVNYLVVQGRDLPRTVNVNLAPPTVLIAGNAVSLGVTSPVPQQLGRTVFGPGRLNPAFDGVFDVQPSAASTYHGVTWALNRRLADDVEWSVAYTWSRTKDSASDFDEQPQNPYALRDEWGASRYDQPHRLVANTLIELPIGEEEDQRSDVAPSPFVRALSHIEIAPILTIASGLPANVITGADDNRTRAFPFTSRPLGVARNFWRLPASATLDVRVLKYFPIKPHGKLDIVLEMFNVLNRTNVTQTNTVYGPFQTPLPAFGRPIEAGPARQFQISVDFEF